MHSNNLQRGYLHHQVESETSVKQFGRLVAVMQDPVSQFAYVLSCADSCTLGDAWQRAAWGDGCVSKFLRGWIGYPRLFWIYRIALLVCMGVLPRHVYDRETYADQLLFHIVLMGMGLLYFLWEFAALIGHFTLMDKDAERRRCWFYCHTEAIGDSQNTFLSFSRNDTHRIAALGISNESATILAAQISASATFDCMVLGKAWRIAHYYQKGGWILSALRALGLVLAVLWTWRPSWESGAFNPNATVNGDGQRWCVGFQLVFYSIIVELFWSAIVYKCCGHLVCQCCFCDPDD